MGEAKARLKRPEVEDPGRELRDWLDLLDELVRTVTSFVGPDWVTEVTFKKMNDPVLGPYKAPFLWMQRGPTRVALDPVTRFAPGTDGVVDLAKMPSYDEVASLYRMDGAWSLHYAFRGSKPVVGVRSALSLPLEKPLLRRVLDEFAGHA